MPCSHSYLSYDLHSDAIDISTFLLRALFKFVPDSKHQTLHLVHSSSLEASSRYDLLRNLGYISILTKGILMILRTTQDIQFHLIWRAPSWRQSDDVFKTMRLSNRLHKYDYSLAAPLVCLVNFQWDPKYILGRLASFLPKFTNKLYWILQQHHRQQRKWTYTFCVVEYLWRTCPRSVQSWCPKRLLAIFSNNVYGRQF